MQCAHLAIIGDHKQLPPVVISPDAKKHLTKSLFERLKVPGIGKRGKRR
jgi:superfamily I DNA and/or RNA helicase